ncbi:MAG TPA: hypothetical protein VF254_05215 [Gammaproteobacteria bacterium]
MKNTFIQIACLAILLVAARDAAAGMRYLEDAYEVTDLRIAMETPDTGSVEVRKCDTCPLFELEITPETKFYKADREISLADAVKYNGWEGVVLQDTATKKVTRIIVY